MRSSGSLFCGVRLLRRGAYPWAAQSADPWAPNKKTRHLSRQISPRKCHFSSRAGRPPGRWGTRNDGRVILSEAKQSSAFISAIVWTTLMAVALAVPVAGAEEPKYG